MNPRENVKYVTKHYAACRVRRIIRIDEAGSAQTPGPDRRIGSFRGRRRSTLRNLRLPYLVKSAKAPRGDDRDRRARFPIKWSKDEHE